MNIHRRTDVRDMVTLSLLFAGGFLIGIGWIAGVLLLWTSPIWRLRDKLIGTLILPFGIGGSIFSILKLAEVFHPSFVMNNLVNPALLLAPFYTAIHLGRRMVTLRSTAPSPVV